MNQKNNSACRILRALGFIVVCTVQNIFVSAQISLCCLSRHLNNGGIQPIIMLEISSFNNYFFCWNILHNRHPSFTDSVQYHPLISTQAYTNANFFLFSIFCTCIISFFYRTCFSFCFIFFFLLADNFQMHSTGEGWHRGRSSNNSYTESRVEWAIKNAFSPVAKYRSFFL